MGLLDQVLGQVIGNMAGGAQGRGGGAPQGGGGLGDLLGQVLGGAQGRPGGAPQGGGGIGDLLGQVLGGGQGRPGGAPQGGGGIGDLLGQVLGGGQAGRGAPEPSPSAPAPSGGGLGGILAGAGGKYSPLVLAVLAILASRNLSSGAGGFGSVLHDILGGGRGAPEGAGRAPDGYEGEDAYGDPPPGSGAPPYPGADQAKGGGGGFLDDVGSILDGPGGASRQASADQGGLGDVLGGGFEELQQRFEQNGQGGLMDSWVGSGTNQAPAPQDLEKALGPGAIDQLSRQLGIERGELLQQLSQALPQVVDGLTPAGRLPTAQDQRGWV